MHTLLPFALLIASSMRMPSFAPQQPTFVLCSCAFEKLVFVRLDLVITRNRVAQLSSDGTVEECEHNSFQHLHPIYTAVARFAVESDNAVCDTKFGQRCSQSREQCADEQKGARAKMKGSREQAPSYSKVSHFRFSQQVTIGQTGTWAEAPCEV